MQRALQSYSTSTSDRPRPPLTGGRSSCPIVAVMPGIHVFTTSQEDVGDIGERPASVRSASHVMMAVGELGLVGSSAFTEARSGRA